MNNDRAKGFYWVMYSGEWIIAEYQGGDLGYWYICGDECGRNDAEFDEIGKAIESKKPKP